MTIDTHFKASLSNYIFLPIKRLPVEFAIIQSSESNIPFHLTRLTFPTLYAEMQRTIQIQQDVINKDVMG